MKHKIALLFTALFLAVGLSWALMLPAGEGTTYYVNGSLSSYTNHDGSTAALAFETINEALDKARDQGDGYVTINVAAGTYKENITFDRGKVSLIGAGQDKTTIGGKTYTDTGIKSVITIDKTTHVSLSNLRILSNGHVGAGSATIATVLISEDCTTTDPIVINNVTIDQFIPAIGGNNTGVGIRVANGASGATISNVTINDHTNGILVLANTTITNATLKGNGKTSAKYGIKVDANTAVVVDMEKITATGYANAGIYYNSNAISSEGSKLKNSTLKNSPVGLETVKGKLTVTGSNIYGKGFDSPLKVSVVTPANIVLGEGTKLYKQFDGMAFEGFISYAALNAKNVTDNGAQFFYGTDYAKSTVIKHSDNKGLKNAYPVEMIEDLFGPSKGYLTSDDILSLPEMTIETTWLRLTTPITIEGNNAILKAKDDQICVFDCEDTDGIIIKNLTFSNAKVFGLAVNDANIELSNVTLKNNLIGLGIGDQSTVSATNLTTQNTKAGVIFKGNGNALTIVSGDYISEDLAVGKIAGGKGSAIDNNVSTDNIAWTPIENTNNKAFDPIDFEGQLQPVTHAWVRTLSIANITAPSPSTIVKGEQLWNSVLTGGKAMYDGQEVSGVFQWETPRTRVGVDSPGSSYPYAFIPDNQKKFAPVLTKLNLDLYPLEYTKVTAAVLDLGKVVIKNASADDYYPEGQVLNLEYVPYEGYAVKPNVSKTFTVGTTDAEIGFGSFTQDTERTEVTFEQPDGGDLQVFNSGKQVYSGDFVKPGSLLNVVVSPDQDKALKSLTYQYGTPVLNGMITVGSEKIIIKAEMETKPSGTFVVGLSQGSGIKNALHQDITSYGIVIFRDSNGNIYMPGMAVPSGTLLTPVVTPTFGYSLSTIKVLYGSVYNHSIDDATALTIDRDVELEPVFTRVKYPVSASIDNTAAGKVELNVTGPQYNHTTVEAEISINAGYKLVAVIANGKELRIADKSGITYEAKTKVFGETTIRVVTRKMEDIVIDQTQQVYTYYGHKMTYPFVVKAVATGLERLGKFTIRYREHSSIGAFNIMMPDAVGTYDVKITRVVGSYYNAMEVIVESGLKIVDNYLPLRDMTHTRKNDPAKPSFTTASATYDGSLFGNLAANPVTVNNWVVTLRQNNLPILHPVNAGVYDIVGFRAADTLYNAQTNVKLGTFTINSAVSNASVTSATDILQGQSLAISRLSGNANIDGTFSWAAPETKMTTAGVITTQKAVFTPFSSNYTTDTNLATSLNVLAMAAGNLRTVTVNVTNPEKGTYTLTREAIPVTAGEIITAGEKIRVCFETIDPAYTAVVKINGAQYPNGALYTVGSTGDMVIDINFMPISLAPTIIAVSDINLSSLEKIVTMGDVFTLTPSIIPSNASDQRVFWRSSDESIATVNSDGKVTVHRDGPCTITATTAYGHSVSCQLIAQTTANDGVIAGVNVYSLDRQYICIDAASPVKVMISDALGRIVYNEKVSQRELVRLQAGIYFVVVTDETSKATVKVVL